MFPSEVNDILNSQKDKLEGDAKIFAENLKKENVNSQQTEEEQENNQRQYDKLIGAKQKWSNKNNQDEVRINEDENKDNSM